MKKTIALFLAALMLLTLVPFAALAADAPAGYVTVSVTDNGDRDYLLDYCEEEDMCYLEPFGVIVPETQVPYYEGETVAKVLTRLFEMNGITWNAWGTTDLNGGFYLSSITFTKDGETVENFGEGSITPDDEYMYYFSGWMVMLNNCFTSSGISDYLADDGDVVRMLYTCSMGADLGNDWSNACADITGINVDASYGTVSPAFSADVKAYTLTVGEDVDEVKLSVDNAYYGAVVTYSVGEVEYKYMRAIPVTNGTVIAVNSKYYASVKNEETGEYDLVLSDEDEITVTVVKPEPAQPADPEPAAEEKSALEQLKDAFMNLVNLFRTFFRAVADLFANLIKK